VKHYIVISSHLMLYFVTPHLHDVSYRPDVSEEEADPTNDIAGDRKFIVFDPN